ncbi:hypothetical protein [Kitasatospora sp. NPDC007106]|uniref:hypothetical protein n=1 Tax=Kitasatospora sp. NPDC007106 TaxID=3156914 RepID=UPI0033DC3CD3
MLSAQDALLAVAALTTAVAVVLLFVRSAAIGVCALAGGQAWLVLARGQVPVLGAGISLYPLDLLTVCAGIAAVVSVVRRPIRPTPGHAALAVLGLLVAVSVVTGMAAYGVQGAGNDARVYFLHALGAICYTATARSGKPLDRLVVRLWTVLACVYCLAAVFWWSRLGIGSNSTSVLVDGRLVNSRPVDAASALVIAQAAVMLLCNPFGSSGGRLLAGLLLPVVVLLQHRTVWAAAIVMVAGWLLFRPVRSGRKAAGLTLAVLLAATALLVFSLSSGTGLTRNLASSASNEDTLEWRIDSSHLLVGRLNGVHDWLFGLPFGSGFDRLLYGQVVESQPHNFYLHLLLRVGLLGLCAAVWLVLSVLRRTTPRAPMGLAMWLSVTGMACFCLAYAMPFEQSLLIGLLLREPAAPGTARPAVPAEPSLRLGAAA